MSIHPSMPLPATYAIPSDKLTLQQMEEEKKLTETGIDQGLESIGTEMPAIYATSYNMNVITQAASSIIPSAERLEVLVDNNNKNLKGLSGKIEDGRRRIEESNKLLANSESNVKNNSGYSLSELCRPVTSCFAKCMTNCKQALYIIGGGVIGGISGYYTMFAIAPDQPFAPQIGAAAGVIVLGGSVWCLITCKNLGERSVKWIKLKCCPSR